MSASALPARGQHQHNPSSHAGSHQSHTDAHPRAVCDRCPVAHPPAKRHQQTRPGNTPDCPNLFSFGSRHCQSTYHAKPNFYLPPPSPPSSHRPRPSASYNRDSLSAFHDPHFSIPRLPRSWHRGTRKRKCLVSSNIIMQRSNMLLTFRPDAASTLATQCNTASKRTLSMNSEAKKKGSYTLLHPTPRLLGTECLNQLISPRGRP